MTKQAMVNVCEAGFAPMLQVHDELAFSIDSPEQAKELAQIMESAVPLQVPNKCDIEVGPSWGECEDLNDE
jgi:DNA polymerase I-like protein with 3'-5' exonuclease and polymerase domains